MGREKGEGRREEGGGRKRRRKKKKEGQAGRGLGIRVVVAVD